MDRPQKVYKMCPPKINKETDQSERMDITKPDAFEALQSILLWKNASSVIQEFWKFTMSFIINGLLNDNIFLLLGCSLEVNLSQWISMRAFLWNKQ